MDYSMGDDDATDIAMNKWFFLKSIKNVKSSVCKSCWLKLQANKEPNEVDGLDYFVETHKKLKEIMSEYMTRFTDPTIAKNDIEEVKSAFINCLKCFPTDDTFFSLYTSGKQSIEKYLNGVTVNEYYNSSYDICLTQHISHTMQRNFKNNDRLFRIWFRIVRQMFLDSMYLACSREALCKEDEMANEDFRQNPELRCVQSEIFYDDLMGFFKNVLGNKNKLLTSKKIINVIIDVSQYLIHYLMRNLEKINNDPDFFEYENSFVTELMAYLQFNPDYQKTIKQIYLPKDMTLSWASMPNKRFEVREILSLLDIDTDKYEKCLKTAASLSLICARYKTCVNNIIKNKVCIKYAKKNSSCMSVNTNRGDETEEKCKNISIIPYQMEVSESLTVRLLYTGSNVFDELDAAIDKEIISCVYFTCSKPLKQKIDKLNNLCGFTKTEKMKQVSKPVIERKRKINKKVKTQSTRIERASDSQESLSSVDEQLDDLVELVQSKSKILCDTQSKAKKGIQKQKTDITSTSKDTHERFEVKENTHKSKNMTLAAKTQPKNLLGRNRSNIPKNIIRQLSPKQKDKKCSSKEPSFNCKNAAYSKVHGDNVESIGDQNQYTGVPHMKDTVKPIEEEIKQALSRKVLANEPLLQLQSDFDLQDAIVDHQSKKVDEPKNVPADQNSPTYSDKICERLQSLQSSSGIYSLF